RHLGITEHELLQIGQFLHAGKCGVRDLGFRKDEPLEFDKACNLRQIGDLGLEEVKLLEIGQLLEMLQARIADPGFGKAQLSEIFQSAHVDKISVGKGCIVKEKPFESPQVFERAQADRCYFRLRHLQHAQLRKVAQLTQASVGILREVQIDTNNRLAGAALVAPHLATQFLDGGNGMLLVGLAVLSQGNRCKDKQKFANHARYH